ncbi:hypothetical protein ACTOB_001727 [Actinoplanes oblitus]|uniref:Uncharacterized protein n=1 Tax=Actinoplanes oblitus TaxID=3040509 RepID=A0ABY8WPA3_9ACTN|nr:hypothetical protein [Actinoplanes oblitus]WIM98144.1 hypothetical protein ACTOB_001727 [Actinoplanes oblitus]
MIPASFPLILVAAVCLAIGLVRGSSSLFIASIVASLLATVVIVIGARQNAAARRTGAPDPAEFPDDPGFAEGAEPPRRASAAPSDAHDSAPAGAAFAADSGYPGDSPHAAGASFAADSPEPAATSAAAGRTDPIGFPAASAEPVYADQPPADQGDTVDLPAAADPPPGGLAGVGDPASRAFSAPGDPASRASGGVGDPASGGAEQGFRAPAASSHLPDETPAAADYHAASSTIGAARGSEADDQSWRRPAAESPAAGPVGPEPAAGEAAGAPERGFPAQASGPGTPPGDGGPGTPPRDGGLGVPPRDSGPGVPLIDSGQDAAAPSDDFAEPDADDPDDEPLPQSVRPTDAVQVARLDTEVLVVDGRPRYHMADCPHLVGRLTEPLPAAEAVELGFSPCGLCRPVDRLLGANAHR